MAIVPTAPVTAQTSSRAIVQPLPSPSAQTLNDALRRLSQNPQDLLALLDAGEASLDLKDDDAAIGFFVRARQVSPSSARAIAGLAKAQLAVGRPVEALRLFAQAEQAGAAAASIAADRGLAFDLVGDNRSAQELYRSSLAIEDDPELRRRLALSLAISGDQEGFERELYSQLAANDRAAFRARAFGLAILGDADEAVNIAETMMPTDLALRIAPYLRYMPRLTKAQQAAAANLGVFPRAAEIGRDSADIAEYAAEGQAIAARASDSLTPQGAPMGSQGEAAPRAAEAREPRRRPDRSGSRDTASGVATTMTPEPRANEAPAQAAAVDPPAAVAQTDPEPVVSPQTTDETTFDLAEVPSTAVTEDTAAPEPISVAQAFSNLGPALSGPVDAGSSAVDITGIEPPREIEATEPQPPEHPARHWVQVATGRDRVALRFDWRRIARQAEGKLDGKGPFITPWGEANRLLAGPYQDNAAAREIVNELRDLGIDTFTFASEEGQEIETLP